MYKKKHSSLIYSNKYELEKLNPLHLFFYIQEKCHSKFTYSKSITFNSYMNKSYYKQVYQYLLAKNKQQLLQSFNNSLQDIISRSASLIKTHHNSIDYTYYQNKFTFQQKLINNDLSIFEPTKSNITFKTNLHTLINTKIQFTDFPPFLEINQNIKYNQQLIKYYIQQIESLPKQEHLSSFFTLFKKIRYLIAYNCIQNKKDSSFLIHKSTNINHTLCNINFIKDLTSP